ncbi:hypothetical protein ABEB36_012906 [Hypothenemus hampei]|uniref:Transposase Tc1-like domain-containing protein n=1 Tax=Hypothenemus hampei TaxID=57062 RepID=A0ABD1E6H4_HYPHA
MFKIVKKWREQGTIERARGTGLENKKTTNNEDATLIQHLRAHPFTTATAAAQITNFPASRRTAQRRIRQISDFRCRVAAIKPFLTQQNKENRMGYAMQYLIFDQNFWENVIFTDEKVFQSSRNGKIRDFVLDSMKHILNKTIAVVDFPLMCGPGLVVGVPDCVGELMVD